MPFPIEEKLVIAVSSSALFDLSESHQVYLDDGPEYYKQYQENNVDNVLKEGFAFPFIKRFLNINKLMPEELPVEVVLLSRNSAATGQRVFRSIEHYGLDITRAAFMEGAPPYKYIPAFNASLFLTVDEDDVIKAIESGFPAGIVLSGNSIDDSNDNQLRIAFDFDGVIADDESETVYKNGDLDRFHEHEVNKSSVPHNPGPLADLFKKLSAIQKLEDELVYKSIEYKRIVRTSIVTARSAPAHERVVTTLESWGVSANETFFLGGMAKDRILNTLQPHIFFDDQKSHLKPANCDIPMVHIPFGVANKS